MSSFINSPSKIISKKLDIFEDYSQNLFLKDQSIIKQKKFHSYEKEINKNFGYIEASFPNDLEISYAGLLLLIFLKFI